MGVPRVLSVKPNPLSSSSSSGSGPGNKSASEECSTRSSSSSSLSADGSRPIGGPLKVGALVDAGAHKIMPRMIESGKCMRGCVGLCRGGLVRSNKILPISNYSSRTQGEVTPKQQVALRNFKKGFIVHVPNRSPFDASHVKGVFTAIAEARPVLRYAHGDDPVSEASFKSAKSNPDLVSDFT